MNILLKPAVHGVVQLSRIWKNAWTHQFDTQFY